MNDVKVFNTFSTLIAIVFCVENICVENMNNYYSYTSYIFHLKVFNGYFYEISQSLYKPGANESHYSLYKVIPKESHLERIIIPTNDILNDPRVSKELKDFIILNIEKFQDVDHYFEELAGYFFGRRIF